MPLFAVTIFSGGSSTRRLLSLLAGLVMLTTMRANIAAYFPIWLLGVGVGLAPPSCVITRQRARILLAA